MNTFLGRLAAVESVAVGEIRSDAGCVMPEVSSKAVKIKPNYTLGLGQTGFWLDEAGAAY